MKPKIEHPTGNNYRLNIVCRRRCLHQTRNNTFSRLKAMNKNELKKNKNPSPAFNFLFQMRWENPRGAQSNSLSLGKKKEEQNKRCTATVSRWSSAAATFSEPKNHLLCHRFPQESRHFSFISQFTTLSFPHAASVATDPFANHQPTGKRNHVTRRRGAGF